LIYEASSLAEIEGLVKHGLSGHSIYDVELPFRSEFADLPQSQESLLKVHSCRSGILSEVSNGSEVAV
jgi:hypothetical protein